MNAWERYGCSVAPKIVAKAQLLLTGPAGRCLAGRPAVYNVGDSICTILLCKKSKTGGMLRETAFFADPEKVAVKLQRNVWKMQHAPDRSYRRSCGRPWFQ
jgi:hypothetical protein